MKITHFINLKTLLFFVIIFIVGCQNNNIDKKEVVNNVLHSSKQESKPINIDSSEASIQNPVNKSNWKVEKYKDEFGDYTKKKYINYAKVIFVSFPNYIKNNEEYIPSESHELTPAVNFFINTLESISIQFDDDLSFAKNENQCTFKTYKIKVNSSQKSEVLIPNKIKNKLILNKNDSKKLSKILLKGGEINFIVLVKYNCDTDFSKKYTFKIQNADGFEDIIKEL